ncbi:Error-prone DNA polymerase [uncultured archaeon]|nr:Error-prone DNA polymerase [uncultured archaeon]
MKRSAAVLRADLHIHTHFSFDSLAKPEDILAAAVDKGLSAVAITDHNEIAGALEAAEMARERKLPLQVIIGEEVSTDRGDLLVYFLKKKIAPGPLSRVLSEAKRQGAVSCAAHPYDAMRHGIALESLAGETLSKIDAIEAFNARVAAPSHNGRALAFAEKAGKPLLAGSDAHHPLEVGSAAVEFSGISRLTKSSILLARRSINARLSSPLVHLLSRYASLRRKLPGAKK